VYGWEIDECPMHLKWDDHIDTSWADELSAGIQAPRDHGKTTRIARGRMTWELGRSTIPDLAWRRPLRVKILANVDLMASRTVQQIRRDMLLNKRLQAVFPDLKEPDHQQGEWTKHALYIDYPEEGGIPINERDPSLEGRGIFSTLTSGRADMLCLDDICDMENSLLSPAKREKVLTAFREDVMQIAEPWCRTVNIGTAWHELDANAVLQTMPGWRWITFRVQETPMSPIVSVWETKWSVAALEKRLGEIGEVAFNRAFNNWPLSDSGGDFRWKDIEACFDPTIAPGEAPFNVRRIYCGYDLAMSMLDSASFFAAFALGISGDGRWAPVHVHRDKIPFRAQAAYVVDLHRNLHPMPIMHTVENNAYQDALVQYLQEKHTALPVEGFTTTSNKRDLQYGVPSVQPSFEARTWVIGTRGGHDGTSLPDCDCGQCTWLRELRYYPAATFDMVMAMWLAVVRARGGSTARGRRIYTARSPYAR